VNLHLRFTWLLNVFHQVIKKFRAGGYNVLVSTSVGEEGLDIGEIDMIVCYDAQKTPIRMVGFRSSLCLQI
jgi:ERCC4-related helicase